MLLWPMSLAVRSPWLALWLVLVIWMMVMMGWGCGLKQLPQLEKPASYPPPLRYCADFAEIHNLKNYDCGDALLPFELWDDKAVICIDHMGLCADLGDLRNWLARYQTRRSA